MSYGKGYVISRSSSTEDEPHGEGKYWFRNGFTAKGAYQHGERIGPWTVHDTQDNITTVHYEDGQLLAPEGNQQQ